MLKGRTLLAVVPARGGSKGVPLKNIYPLMGKPLLAYVSDIIREAGCFDQAVASTDHPKIAEVARASGLQVPFIRPESLSGDFIADFPVLKHALMEIEAIDRRQYDVIVMLQPTCPLRKAQHVIKAINYLIDREWDAVWTISPTDVKYHPMKTLRLEENGKLALYLPRGNAMITRQQLDPAFHRNGIAYVFSRESLILGDTTLPERSSAVIIEDPMISIDTLEDFASVELIMREEQSLLSK